MMKLRDLKDFPVRVRLLVTRKFTWVVEETGYEYTEKYSFREAWSIVGISSYNWWWVNRYGKLACGCTRNPLTRRMVLYLWGCPVHMPQVADLDKEGEAEE